MIKSAINCPCGRSFTKTGYKGHKCDQKIPTFTCEFCKKDFTTEKYLVNHLCETKRRYQQKEDKRVWLGYMAYERFWKSMGKRATYDGFVKSTYYGAFVRFGKHIADLNAVRPMAFVDFLIQIEAKIDNWTSMSLYSTYITELNKNEPPIDAIERNFLLMQEWSVSSDEEWYDFFRKVEPTQAVMWIISGRLTPWLLFTASSAHLLISRLTSEQNQIVENVINADYWQAKMARHQKEVDTIRNMLAEYGI